MSLELINCILIVEFVYLFEMSAKYEGIQMIM